MREPDRQASIGRLYHFGGVSVDLCDEDLPICNRGGWMSLAEAKAELAELADLAAAIDWYERREK